MQSIADQLAVYTCLAQEFPVFDEELRGLRVLAVQGGTPPALITATRPSSASTICGACGCSRCTRAPWSCTTPARVAPEITGEALTVVTRLESVTPPGQIIVTRDILSRRQHARA